MPSQAVTAKFFHSVYSLPSAYKGIIAVSELGAEPQKTPHSHHLNAHLKNKHTMNIHGVLINIFVYSKHAVFNNYASQLQATIPTQERHQLRVARVLYPSRGLGQSPNKTPSP